MNCDQLTGRMRDICRGVDDAGKPVLTPEKRAFYIAKWMDDGLLSPPTTYDKATSFLSAMKDYVRSGSQVAPDAVVAARYSMCRECPLFATDTEICRECGCRLKTKCRWAVSECPLGKWGPYVGESNPNGAEAPEGSPRDD